MKRILGILLGLFGAVMLIAGCSKEKSPQAKEEPTSVKVAAVPKKKDITEEPTKKESSGKEKVIDLGKGVKLEMILIPAGKFKMGDSGGDHEVTLTKPFYMGKFEVMQEQWESVMGNNPSEIKAAKLPVTDVSWEDCYEFIKKLNAKTDGDYRLPTESEWEYACRAGTTTAYSFGDTITPSQCLYFSDLKMLKPVAAGGYKPNAFGLYDMHGNVWEWCEDWYSNYPAGAVTDPKGPATGKDRMLRGGSFGTGASSVSSSSRSGNTPTFRGHFNGFRLARTADIKAGAAPNVTKPDPTAVIPATRNLLVAPFLEAKAKEAQKEVAKSLKREVEEKEDLGNGVKLEMILIPAGKFVMGSPESEKGRHNETQHEVTLKSYYIGKYEVTQGQWEAVMGNNPSNTKGAKLPVTGVSWPACQEFIKKLNEKTKGEYRLLSEAEWEYACRAGTSTVYAFGDRLTKIDANIDGADIKVVGSYKPNAFGLYDMHGNVWEWCEDWYGYDYPAGAVADPKGSVTGDRRVVRGGSCTNWGSVARSSSRAEFLPTNGNPDFGFRLARTP
jgi:formylglycine-generating enzyme required for sulfatase activity